MAIIPITSRIACKRPCCRSSGKTWLPSRDHRERLERIPQPQRDPPVPAVRVPLQPEASIIDPRLRDSKIARVERVVELRAHLQPLPLRHANILVDSEVDVVDPVCAQNIASRVA